MNLNTTPSRTLDNLLRSRLVAALTAPHGVDRYLDWLAPERVTDEMRSRVLARRMETADCVTLTLAVPRGWRGHSAGQHLTVSVELDGRRQTRCFSIASADNSRNGELEITVKAQPDGQVSRFLVDAARPGTTVVLSDASGAFRLPDIRPAGVLLISGGSGITPVMSMLRSLVNEGYEGEIRFLHYARSSEDLIFADELDELTQQHSNLTVYRAFTSDDAVDGELQGRFKPAHLQDFGPAHNDWPAFACGPQPLIEGLQSHWSAQAAGSRLDFEYFQPPRAAAADGQGVLQFVRSQVIADDDGRSLLDQAEAADLKPAYGCRMGICRSCTCRKTSGRVRNLLTGRISEDGAEDIQPCITAPASDVSVEL